MKQVAFQEVIKRLNEHGIGYRILDLTRECQIIVCCHGAQLWGPFYADGTPITWTPSAFLSPDAFLTFLSGRSSPLGGDNLKITCIRGTDRKEVPLMVNQVPANTDSSIYYNFSPEKGYMVMKEKLLIPFESEPVPLSLTIKTFPISDPLGNYAKRPKDLKFVGYGQDIHLENSLQRDCSFDVFSYLHIWSGGTVRIPYTHKPDWVDLQTPVGKRQAFKKAHVDVWFDGTQPFKVVYPSAFLMGRAGYFQRFSASEAYLLVRNFCNDPSAEAARVHSDASGPSGYNTFLQQCPNTNGSCGIIGNRLTLQNMNRMNKIGRLQTWIFRGSAENIAETAGLLLSEE